MDCLLNCMRNNFCIWLIIFCFAIEFNANSQTIKDLSKASSVSITRIKKIGGDFSFIHRWEYPLGVEKMKDGKAGCSDGGFCPQRCYGMLDSNGIVLKDSAELFYQLLDTAHIPFSIQCEARCYEFAGTNTVQTFRKNDTIVCISDATISTHCSLEIYLIKDKCIPVVVLNSIRKDSDKIFYAEKGFITIDKNYFKKGILKAEFDFTFANPDDKQEPVFWKGKIYSDIQPAK
jgi:hypothetical protein